MGLLIRIQVSFTLGPGLGVGIPGLEAGGRSESRNFMNLVSWDSGLSVGIPGLGPEDHPNPEIRQRQERPGAASGAAPGTLKLNPGAAPGALRSCARDLELEP